MNPAKADIIARLQKEILTLQGYKSCRNNQHLQTGLGPINQSFPNNTFPLDAVHEFIFKGKEDAAATTGFVAGILSSLMANNGAAFWISTARSIFPPALEAFGISPDKIIFIQLKKEKDIQWAMEEALQCEGLSAVIGEMSSLSFKASRRLQLAVEASKVTGFILRNDSTQMNATACTSRWMISSLPSLTENDMPGVGFPRWHVELHKIRNGRPGSWEVEFVAGRFRHSSRDAFIYHQLQKRTG